MSEEEFYSSKFEVIFRFFYYKVLDVAKAEDMCQDTFHKFFQSYRKLLEKESDKAGKILYGIARNVWRSFLSFKQKLFLTFSDYNKDGKEFEIISNYNFQDSEQNNKKLSDNQKLLRQEIKRLPKQLSTVLELHIYNNLSKEETAQLMGISPSSVRKYKQRAIAKLKQVFKA